MSRKNTIQYSVISPVYNSESSLRLLHNRLGKVFDSLHATWELILVNDCSEDSSWEVMQGLAGHDKRVTAVNLTNNFGQHNAQMCGFNYAQGEYIITMDDDLQHPPEEIPKLIKTLKEGTCSIVYGQYAIKRHGWFRNACSNAVNAFIGKVTGSGYKVTHFRIIKRSVIEKITKFKQFNPNIDVFIKNIVSVRDVGHALVEHQARIIGKSNYSFKKLFAYALNMIFSHTILPLRIGTMLGLVFATVSLLLGLYFLIEYLFLDTPVRGFASIAIIMTFFFGITLSVLGVIGEYVGGIFLNSNQKPQYIVKEVYTSENN